MAGVPAAAVETDTTITLRDAVKKMISNARTSLFQAVLSNYRFAAGVSAPMCACVRPCMRVCVVCECVCECVCVFVCARARAGARARHVCVRSAFITRATTHRLGSTPARGAEEEGQTVQAARRPGG